MNLSKIKAGAKAAKKTAQETWQELAKLREQNHREKYAMLLIGRSTFVTWSSWQCEVLPRVRVCLVNDAFPGPNRKPGLRFELGWLLWWCEFRFALYKGGQKVPGIARQMPR
jgi:hypothetical protein